jgi:hypothetical protein
VNRVILLLVDGLSPTLAERMLTAGDLPAFAAMLDNGSMARAITAFPSTTSVAYLPFLTGCTPGQCNVPSIRWLDRTRYQGRWWKDREAVRSYCGYQAVRLDADIAAPVRTIFELVPESLGIFTPIARGLTPDRDPSRGERKFWGALAHYALWHQPSDTVVSRHLLRGVDAGHRFIFAQFPAVDGYTHQRTPEDPIVQRSLRLVDQTVGRLRERLQARNELDDTLILMVSDHGATVVHTHLDLADWFRNRGVATLSHPVIWERNPEAAVMVAGNGSAMVYARPGQSRPSRWSLRQLRDPAAFGAGRDLVAALAAEPAVAFVAAEQDGGIRVLSGSGEAEVRRTADGRISYARMSGDPLRLEQDLSADEREWLEASWDAPFPDAPFHLVDQFRAARTGDLLVVANEGYDFRERFEVPEHKSGHGSMFRAHMQTPVWSSHPGFATPLRTVDLFPTMLEWLGVRVPSWINAASVGSPRSAGVA